MIGGQVQCDSSACTPPPLTDPECKKDGNTYKIGETFKGKHKVFNFHEALKTQTKKMGI